MSVFFLYKSVERRHVEILQCMFDSLSLKTKSQTSTEWKDPGHEKSSLCR